MQSTGQVCSRFAVKTLKNIFKILTKNKYAKYGT